MAEQESDKLGQRFKAITADLKRYIEKRVELLLLTAGEQYSRWVAESIQRVTGIFLLAGALIFLLVALAIYLGDVLDNESLGYVLVSLPLFAMGLLLYYLKPKSLANTLQRHFEEELVKALMPEEGTEEQEDKEHLKLPESREET